MSSASAAITAGYIRTRCSPGVNIADLHSYALQNLVGTQRCKTFVRPPHLPPLPLATFVRLLVFHQHHRPPFVRVAELRYTPLSDICIYSASAAITADLHSYALLVCRQHCRPTFVRIAEPRWYAPQSDIFISSTSAAIPAGYIRTRCLSAVNIAELHSYALQNLVCMCRCPTFVRAAPLPSTSLTYVRTRSRTSLQFTTVLHSCVLLVCRQNRRPPFIRVAEPCWYSPLSYILTHHSSAVNIANLRLYALPNLFCMCRCPTLVCAAALPSTSLTYVRTRFRTWLEFTTVLHSYTLLVCCQHRRPPFVRVAEPRWYAPLSYIRTRCSSAVYIADLRLYALQNLVRMHCCPTFVQAARLPSTSPTSVRRPCSTSLVCTAVLHLYALLVCRQHRQPLFVRVAEPRWYAPLSYIRTRCSSAVYIADLRSYALQNSVDTHRGQTFVCAPRLLSLPRSYIRTQCSSAVNITDLRSYALLNHVATRFHPTFLHSPCLPP